MALATRRILAESGSIALILLVWAVLSALAYAVANLQLGIQLAGLVMAVLYALVRGVALSSAAEPAYQNPDAESVLVENGRAMLVAAPWFVGTFVVAALIHGPFGFNIVLPGNSALSRTVLASLLQVFAFTGVLSVLLVAVATGTRALRAVRTL